MVFLQPNDILPSEQRWFSSKKLVKVVFIGLDARIHAIGGRRNNRENWLSPIIQATGRQELRDGLRRKDLFQAGWEIF